MKSALLAMSLVWMTWSASAAEPLAARVNGVEITASDVAEYMKMPRKAFLKKGEATEHLIALELMAQEAIRRGHDKNAGRLALASSVFSEFSAANPISEADIKNEYERIKAEQRKPPEYAISMIIVKTSAEAKEILSGLAAGKSFASLASLSIEEKKPWQKDGVVEWTRASDLNPPLDSIVQRMKPGTVYSEPIAQNYGYVVLRLDDSRVVGFPSLEEARNDVVGSLRADRQKRFLRPLADKASIQQFEPFGLIRVSQTGEISYGPYVKKLDVQRESAKPQN